MKRFWRYSAEYAILEDGDRLIVEPIQFGPVILSPGNRITYMGDGRAHRSFEMKDGYSLEYAGYVLVSNEYTSQFLLFSVPEEPTFEKNLYYSFLYLSPPRMLCLYNGIGSRDIWLEMVIFAAHEPRLMRPAQLISLF